MYDAIVCMLMLYVCSKYVLYCIHTTTLPQSQSLFKVYTFNYEAFYVIIWVQAVETIQYMTYEFFVLKK